MPSHQLVNTRSINWKPVVTAPHGFAVGLGLAMVLESDIIVACAGQARMITAAHVKPGACVVDVGVSRSEAGIVGDVDFDAVQAVAGAITPMPRGTGPMTIACLLENTLEAALARRGGGTGASPVGG